MNSSSEEPGFCSPFVLNLRISLAALLQALASFCVKLIGQQQREGGDAGAQPFGILLATKRAISPGKIKAHLHPTSSTPTLSSCFSFELSWIDLYIWCCVTLRLLRHTSLRALFERDGAGFIWPDVWRFSWEKDPVGWGSVTEQRDSFVSSIAVCPALNPHWAGVVVRDSKIRQDFN